MELNVQTQTHPTVSAVRLSVIYRNVLNMFQIEMVHYTYTRTRTNLLWQDIIL